ncbi:MAG: diguanylate cyclase, partial [Clostridia bacterium]|nr:diguanylate cyclase [Clostridia bacterium]
RYNKKNVYMTLIIVLMIIFLIGYINGFTDIDSDIMLSGVFFLLAWLLSNMTETEAKIREELERMASHDSLTDILNHRSFQNILDEKIIEAKEKGYSLSLLLLDLDYFKVYNDSLGHQKGDMALKTVANIIKKFTEDIGYCARYGGEEFVIILPGTEIENAKELAERIRKAIENTEFNGMEVLPKGRLTVSIGIAQYPNQADSKEKLIQKADEALYRAKFVSKNKVEVYYSVFDDLNLELKEKEKELLNSIRTLTMVINAKDRYTFGHSERTMELSKNFAKSLNLDDRTTKDLIYGSLLHDIGKIEIPREVLNKPAKLSKAEWNLFRNHPQWGADIIRPIKSLQGSLEIILHHHENYDGSGYPKGLKGEEIPFGARILRIVDSFDALITNRPYKEAMSKEQALEELKRFSGSYYDPYLLNKFCEIVLRLELQGNE